MDGIGRDLAFEDPLDDPYLDQARLAEDSSDEDVNITTGDQLILAASTEDDAASLNVYLYNDELAQLYVHHDVMLPDMPLVVGELPSHLPWSPRLIILFAQSGLAHRPCR